MKLIIYMVSMDLSVDLSIERCFVFLPNVFIVDILHFNNSSLINSTFNGVAVDFRG